jgi:hypothetical protein
MIVKQTLEHYWKVKLACADTLFENIKKNKEKAEKLLEKITCYEGEYEGKIYRFYHSSFKVYHLQDTTIEITELLKEIDPKMEKAFCEDFEEILREGTGKIWEIEHNREWTKHTRPIVEAFFHAKYFLEMVVYWDKQEKNPPQMLPQSWAALLELYNIR